MSMFTPSPEFVRARGFAFLLDYINGKSIPQIGRERHADVSTVRKYMRKVAATLIDSAHEKILQDLFPKAVELMSAEMDRQIARAKKGEEVDWAIAERIMKGMFVFDSPQLKDVEMERAEEEVQVDSLKALMAIRRPSLPTINIGK